jgi:hypothetical protein
MYEEFLNIKFVEDGRSPEEGFDCAGFVIYLLSLKGKNIKAHKSVWKDRRLQNQALLLALSEECEKIDKPNEDVIVTFWTDNPLYSNHVGLCINRTEFIEIRRSTGVSINRLADEVNHITGFYKVKE